MNTVSIGLVGIVPVKSIPIDLKPLAICILSGQMNVSLMSSVIDQVHKSNLGLFQGVVKLRTIGAVNRVPYTNKSKVRFQ